MKLLQYWRGLFLVFAALLLTGCIPNAEFKVTPQPLSAGQMATFDASASTPFLASRGNSLVSYAWDFGDGAKASGKVATHTYATKGEYLVQLTVKDTQGLSDTRRLKLKVGEAVGGDQAKVLVRSAQGVLLGNAEVSIGGVVANSNAEGVADLSGVPAGDQVVLVKKAGFVTQAQQLKLEAGTPAQVQVLLQPVKEVKQIADIAAAQAILGETLGAQIVLPANAFVDAAGIPATGSAKLQLTPWDISGDDLQAMPGNGRAIGADGQMTDLISAGMMTVDFIDAQGKHLQLAEGKTAKIRLNLPYDSIGGHKLAVGSEIPLWHFDEALGLWKEEGKGYVVAAPGTPSGLAVEAEVSHFSTWNWDFVYNESNRLDVKCVDSSNLPVACYVVANVTLDDGSHLSKSASLPPEGRTIVNLPTNGSVSWVAEDGSGLKGAATSGVSGSVTIQLEEPPTSNFVSCELSDATPVACRVTLRGIDDSGVEQILENYIPAGGAKIQTLWKISSLDWSGIASEKRLSQDGKQWLTYRGTAVSGAKDKVSLVLDQVSSSPVDKKVRVKCEAGDTDPANPKLCDIRVRLQWGDGGEHFLNFTNVPLGQVVSFNASSTTYWGLALEGYYAPSNGKTSSLWLDHLADYPEDKVETLQLAVPRPDNP